jgi:hypothetical protein
VKIFFSKKNVAEFSSAVSPSLVSTSLIPVTIMSLSPSLQSHSYYHELLPSWAPSEFRSCARYSQHRLNLMFQQISTCSCKSGFVNLVNRDLMKSTIFFCKSGFVNLVNPVIFGCESGFVNLVNPVILIRKSGFVNLVNPVILACKSGFVNLVLVSSFAD